MSSENAHTILAVDDNEDALYALERILAMHGYAVQTAANGEEAIAKARSLKPSMVLLDIMMPVVDGLEVTKQLKADAELRFIPVILLTAKDSLDDIVEGLDCGADGYISKPFKPEELLARIRATLRLRSVYQELKSSEARTRALTSELSSVYSCDSIVGESKAMQSVFHLVGKVAADESPVLINGPSGTGKELIARAIHFGSARATNPFVAKNCAAFAEQLLESELFGHVKGAFTGAVKDSKGLFEAADGGTLFLDEIGELAAPLQAKLLRVLQEGTFSPVGSTEERHADVRVLAATNRDLPKMIEDGSFREDLYYRLNVICIDLPPLASRQDDIPLLIAHFLEKGASRRGLMAVKISDECLRYLSSYPWPGNVRELENEIERMLILSDAGEELGAELLSARILAVVDGAGESKATDSEAESTSLRKAVEKLERSLIAEVLEAEQWNKSNAAKTLGISRSNLIQKVRLYELEKDDV